jgi:hypothetical protein
MNELKVSSNVDLGSHKRKTSWLSPCMRGSLWRNLNFFILIFQLKIIALVHLMHATCFLNSVFIPSQA